MNPTGSVTSPSPGGARFLPGSVLDRRYRIVSLLGRGGMGEVYRADDLKLGQSVALKLLPAGLEHDEQHLTSLLNEVRTARQVTHPNVCRVYDIGEVDGQHYLSMEYVDGEDLASLLRRIGRLPKEKAVQVAWQACAGIAAAHEQGILHRDLKPANVMIDGRGRVKITDFGLAGLQGSFQQGENRSGTPAYMAPEQLEGQEVTARSDIYSLGLVLYELFTGHPAFAADTMPELVRLRREAVPVDPARHVEGFDPGVRRIILRCLEREPNDRPASAQAVAAALPGGDPLAAAVAAGDTPSPEMVANAGGTGGLRPAVAVAALALVLLGIAVSPFLFQALMLAGQVPLGLPPEALTVKAREIVRDAGYVDPPVHSAHGFAFDADYLEHVDRQDPSVRWRDLASVRPAPIHFWYRQSPGYLTPTDFINVDRLWFPTISPDDPAPVVSGMIGVRLDPQGRLLRFEAVPPQIDDSSESGAEPRWSLLFERAGVDLATFTPARPTWSALGGTDLRRAWEGAWPDGPRTALRVEAAAWRGRPTFFQLVTPWTKPRGVVSRPWGPGERLWSIVFGLVVLPLVLVGALILARRNLRRGRGDRRGAFRVALFAFVCGTAGWVFAGDHQPTFAELGLLFQSVAWNLMFAAIIWLVYLALEPYARRVWPEGLVSWSRLLQGGWRDPLVGRDILIGGLAHFVTYALFTGSYLLPVWMGLPLERPIPSTWLGFRQSIGNMFGSVQGTVVATIVTLFLLLLLRLPLRSTWAAAIALTLLYSLGSLFATANPWIVGPIQVFVLGLELFVLVRFGILAFLSAYCFSALLGSGPFSWDLSAWTTGVSLVQVSLVVAVAFYAFRVALAGRALFRESLFEEGSVGASGRGSGSR